MALVPGDVPMPAAQRAQAPPLIFVADAAYPPLSWLEHGVARGFDVEFVAALAQAMGREIRLDLLQYAEAQRRVLDGEADALTDLGFMPERRAQFEFSDAVLTHEFGFYVRRDDSSVHGLADVFGKRVGVTPSPFVPSFLTRQTDAALTTVASFEEGFGLLKSGQLDVLAFDSWVAAPMARRYASDVTLVGVPFATNATAVAVRRGRHDLIAEINAGIRLLKSRGAITAIEARWRPSEMLFVPERFVGLIGAVALLAAVLGLSAWVISLKRAIRRERDVESALVASEGRFATAFRASPDGMAIIDLETHRFVDASRQLTISTGYAYDEIIGRTAEMIGLLTNDATAVARARQALATTGSVRDVEFHVRNKDRSVRLVVGSAERIEVGGRQCGLWVLRDVTTARAVEDQLRQAQKMDAVGRLAAGVAHDFNNLLTVIMGHCEMAGATCTDDTTRRALRDVRASASRAAALTGQLLAFSRRQLVQPQVVDLNQAIHESQPMLMRLIGEDVSIELALDADAGCLSIDPGQLQQVLLNLAANARDAMPDGGRLRFQTSRVLSGPTNEPPADYVCLKVIDSGTGIDLETKARMFEPFFTTKPAGHGTGLGLATVQGIVQASRGSLTVESVAGGGTQFRLVWPRVAEGAAPPAETERHEVSTGGAERLLLVEDEAELREMLHDYLAGLGYQVTMARSGEEAIAISEASAPPDLLVTDVVMNGMTGRQLADWLTARHPAMRVLYVSGYTDDAVLRRGVLSSHVHFLQKPFSLTTLAAKIREVISGAAPA